MIRSFLNLQNVGPMFSWALVLWHGKEHSHGFAQTLIVHCTILLSTTTLPAWKSLGPPPNADWYPTGCFCWCGLPGYCLGLLCISFVSGIISAKHSPTSWGQHSTTSTNIIIWWMKRIPWLLTIASVAVQSNIHYRFQHYKAWITQSTVFGILLMLLLRLLLSRHCSSLHEQGDKLYSWYILMCSCQQINSKQWYGENEGNRNI